ncbi:Cyclase/dehydrase (fragment) [Candidatus Accumulibacter aalborgensis]|uniref:Cyclase/dehydrase n=1 Tax=Candidatus Accumulibacter aalborgensis TaxID=1860102 RepID=A0A1A8XQC5_9PROT
MNPLRLQERAGVRLDYDARFELARPLPPMIALLSGIGAIRPTMREQFVAMLRQIERRQAAVSAAEHGP